MSDISSLQSAANDDTLALEFHCRDCGVSLICYGEGPNSRARRCLICSFLATVPPEQRERLRRQMAAAGLLPGSRADA